MRKSDLIHLTKLLVAILILSYIVDKVVYFGIYSIDKKVLTGQNRGKPNQFLQLKDSLDFLVFGSSRANHNIDPKKITDKSYNIGIDATKIAYWAALVKTLPIHKKQTLLVHLSTKYAFDNSYEGKDIKKLIKFYNTNDIIKQEIDFLKMEEDLQPFYWCLSYNGSVFGVFYNYLFPAYNHREYSGYDPIIPTSKQQEIFKEILANKKKVVCEHDLNLNPIYLKYIKEINEFCLKNNKNLIFYTAPIYKDNCKENDKIIANLLHQQGITYWNFTDFFKDDNSLENWFDETHLSDTGAQKLTEEIRVKLKNKMPHK